MVFHSGESRWYFKGSLPDNIREWFELQGKGKQESTRTDEYLLLPRCDSTSVKFREGNLEVKAVTRSPEAVSYANGVSGYQDAWVKWSCEMKDVDYLKKMIATTGDRWASVRKSRYLRKYSLDSGAPAEVNAATDRPERGCQVEITSINVLIGNVGASHSDNEWKTASQWWSLSLEAFAPSSVVVMEDVLAHLNVVANHFFCDEPPCNLTKSTSLSYPAWLLRFAS